MSAVSNTPDLSVPRRPIDTPVPQASLLGRVPANLNVQNALVALQLANHGWSAYKWFQGSQEDRDAAALTRMREEPDRIRSLSPRSCAKSADKAKTAIHRLELQAQSVEVVKIYHDLYAKTFGICTKKCPKQQST